MAEVVVRDARTNDIIASWMRLVEVPRVGEYLESDERGKFHRVMAVAYSKYHPNAATVFVDANWSREFPMFEEGNDMRFFIERSDK